MTKKISIALLACVLLVAGIVWARPANDPVSGHGETEFNMISGHASGEGTLTVRGTELAVSIEAQLLEITRESDEGVVHADVMHIFDFGDGNKFTTNDKSVLEPTEGGFIFNERLMIVSGTGAFANASGKLTVHGQMMFKSPTRADVSLDIYGVIAGYEGQ
jgi:hypothetical protein